MDRDLVLKVGIVVAVVLAVLASPNLIPKDSQTMADLDADGPLESEDYALLSRFSVKMTDGLRFEAGETTRVEWQDEIWHDAGNARLNLYETNRSGEYGHFHGTEYANLSDGTDRVYDMREKANSSETLHEECTAEDGTGYRVRHGEIEPSDTDSMRHGVATLDRILAFDANTDGDTTVYTPREGIHRTKWRSDDGTVLVHVPAASGSVTVEDGHVVAANVRADVRILELDGAVIVHGVSERTTIALEFTVETEPGTVSIEEPAWAGSDGTCEY